MKGTHNPDSPISSALGAFGEATSHLLTIWLESLPAENQRMLDLAVSNGASVGVKVLIDARGRASVEMLASLPNGECVAVGTLAHETGRLQ